MPGLDEFSAGMDRLVDHPVEQAFERLGYPDRQEVITGNTVYYWGAEQPVGPTCTFKLVVSPEGQVLDWDGYGNANGCQAYARALN
jgi:hypothetical protein